MGTSATDVYANIKALENAGRLKLPEPAETIEIGVIDADTGTFTFKVPTIRQTISLPATNETVKLPGHVGDTTRMAKANNHGGPGGGGAPAPLINTLGVVATKAVRLLLKFGIASKKRVVVHGDTQLAGGAPHAPIIPPTSGITITGAATASSTFDQITVDMGLSCSAPMPQAVDVYPRISSFELSASIPGHPPQFIQFMIMRPPVVGGGAFTIPALPLTIVYAPPQGADAKNVSTYANTKTFTKSVTTAVTSGIATRTAKAYSAGDLAKKVADLALAVGAVVGTGGAAGAAAGGVSVAGGMAEISTALFGSPSDAATVKSSASDIMSDAKNVFGLLSAVQGAFGTTTSDSPTNATASETDQTLMLSCSTAISFSSEEGLGPGVGDRIVYYRDVKVVWVVVDGELDISVLEIGDLAANPVSELKTELTRLQAGRAGTLELDLETIQSLLAQDVLLSTPPPPTKPPVIRAPRFLPASPAVFGPSSGTGSSSSPDKFSITVDQSSDIKTVTTSTTTNINDSKPGWVDVLLGNSDNVETTTTTSFTMVHTTDIKQDRNVQASVQLFSRGIDDSYYFKLFYDVLFKTFVMVDVNSPLLGAYRANPIDPSQLTPV